MTDSASTPPPASRLRRHGGWVLAALAGLVLLLREIAAPVHATFPALEIFLFHALYGVATAVALVATGWLIERVLVLPRGYGDD